MTEDREAQMAAARRMVRGVLPLHIELQDLSNYLHWVADGAAMAALVARAELAHEARFAAFAERIAVSRENRKIDALRRLMEQRSDDAA